MTVLLDSSVLIQAQRLPESEATRQLGALLVSGEAAVTGPVVIEYIRGARSQEELEFLIQRIVSLEFLEMDQPVWVIAGQWELWTWSLRLQQYATGSLSTPWTRGSAASRNWNCTIQHLNGILKMNIQTYIDEGRGMVEKLLGKQPVPFRGPTIAEIPEESGIYVFSNRETGESLWVGKNEKGSRGLRGRVYDHWSIKTTSDLSQVLVISGIAKDRSESHEWINANVDIRWLTHDELEMDIKWAEYFALGALRPRLNK